jgi:hypothetical protein
MLRCVIYTILSPLPIYAIFNFGTTRAYLYNNYSRCAPTTNLRKICDACVVHTATIHVRVAVPASNSITQCDEITPLHVGVFQSITSFSESVPLCCNGSQHYSFRTLWKLKQTDTFRKHSYITIKPFKNSGNCMYTVSGTSVKVRLHQIMDVNRYIIIINLLDSVVNIRWEPKWPYRRCRLFFHKFAYFIYEVPTWFMLVSCLTYSATFKMEVTCSSERSVDFQRTTQRYIPED